MRLKIFSGVVGNLLQTAKPNLRMSFLVSRRKEKNEELDAVLT